MKTGKKVSITILSVLILALCAVGIIRSTTFPLDPATLPDHICDFYNIGRPQPLSPSIRVYDSVELENTVWYLIEIGEDIDLGYVKLERISLAATRSCASATAAGASVTALCAVGRKPTTSSAAAM